MLPIDTSIGAILHLVMWFIFAVSSALTRAVSQVLRKQAIGHTSPASMTLLMRMLSLPIVILFALVFTDANIPSSTHFWTLVVTAGIIETAATIASFASLKADNLSRVAPVQSFIPVFILVLSLIIFQTIPPVAGIFGVILVTTGIYTLKLERNQAILDPFRKLVRDPGSRLMLKYAFLSAIVFILEKESLQYAHPAVSLAVVYAVQVTCLIVHLALRNKRLRFLDPVTDKKTFSKYMLVIALLTAVSHLLQFYSVDAIYASYVFAVQRIDVILILIFSALFLNEPVAKKLYAAGALTVAGVIILNLT